MVCPRAEPVRELRTVRRFMLANPLWPPEADVLGGEKVSHRFGDIDHVSLEGKVSRIEELDGRVRKVFSEWLGARRDEERIRRAPKGQGRRGRLTKILGKRRIQL